MPVIAKVNAGVPVMQRQRGRLRRHAGEDGGVRCPGRRDRCEAYRRLLRRHAGAHRSDSEGAGPAAIGVVASLPPDWKRTRIRITSGRDSSSCNCCPVASSSASDERSGGYRLTQGEDDSRLAVEVAFHGSPFDCGDAAEGALHLHQALEAGHGGDDESEAFAVRAGRPVRALPPAAAPPPLLRWRRLWARAAIRGRPARGRRRAAPGVRAPAPVAAICSVRRWRSCSRRSRARSVCSRAARAVDSASSMRMRRSSAMRSRARSKCSVSVRRSSCTCSSGSGPGGGGGSGSFGSSGGGSPPARRPQAGLGRRTGLSPGFRRRGGSLRCSRPASPSAPCCRRSPPREGSPPAPQAVARSFRHRRFHFHFSFDGGRRFFGWPGYRTLSRLR